MLKYHSFAKNVWCTNIVWWVCVDRDPYSRHNFLDPDELSDYEDATTPREQRRRHGRGSAAAAGSHGSWDGNYSPEPWDGEDEESPGFWADGSPRGGLAGAAARKRRRRVVEDGGEGCGAAGDREFQHDCGREFLLPPGVCVVCRKGEGVLIPCTSGSCARMYHSSCLKSLGQVGMLVYKNGSAGAAGSDASLCCPAHYCHGCNSTGQLMQMYRCCGCWLRAYHFRCCVPVSAKIVDLGGKFYVLCSWCVAGGVKPPEPARLIDGIAAAARAGAEQETGSAAEACRAAVGGEVREGEIAGASSEQGAAIAAAAAAADLSAKCETQGIGSRTTACDACDAVGVDGSEQKSLSPMTDTPEQKAPAPAAGVEGVGVEISHDHEVCERARADIANGDGAMGGGPSGGSVGLRHTPGVARGKEVGREQPLQQGQQQVQARLEQKQQQQLRPSGSPLGPGGSVLMEEEGSGRAAFGVGASQSSKSYGDSSLGGSEAVKGELQQLPASDGCYSGSGTEGLACEAAAAAVVAAVPAAAGGGGGGGSPARGEGDPPTTPSVRDALKPAGLFPNLSVGHTESEASLCQRAAEDVIAAAADQVAGGGGAEIGGGARTEADSVKLAAEAGAAGRGVGGAFGIRADINRDAGAGPSRSSGVIDLASDSEGPRREQQQQRQQQRQRQHQLKSPKQPKQRRQAPPADDCINLVSSEEEDEDDNDDDVVDLVSTELEDEGEQMEKGDGAGELQQGPLAGAGEEGRLQVDGVGGSGLEEEAVLEGVVGGIEGVQRGEDQLQEGGQQQLQQQDGQQQEQGEELIEEEEHHKGDVWQEQLVSEQRERHQKQQQRGPEGWEELDRVTGEQQQGQVGVGVGKLKESQRQTLASAEMGEQMQAEWNAAAGMLLECRRKTGWRGRRV